MAAPCPQRHLARRPRGRDGRPGGPRRSPARSARFSPPRSGKQPDRPRHHRLPQRPPVAAATPDPDLGHDDLVCRTDRCRTVPHGAPSTSAFLAPSGSAPGRVLRWVPQGRSRPASDPRVGRRRRPCAAHSERHPGRPHGRRRRGGLGGMPTSSWACRAPVVTVPGTTPAVGFAPSFACPNHPPVPTLRNCEGPGQETGQVYPTPAQSTEKIDTVARIPGPCIMPPAHLVKGLGRVACNAVFRILRVVTWSRFPATSWGWRPVRQTSLEDGAASCHDGAVFPKAPITTGTAPWLHRIPALPAGLGQEGRSRPSGPSRSPARSASFSPPRSGNQRDKPHAPPGVATTSEGRCSP